MKPKLKSSLRDFFYDLINIIMKLPQLIVEQIHNFIDHLLQVRENFKDLGKTNLDLGKYHFYNQNLNDAIFRFKIVNKFFSHDNRKANYYLGWCYMKKGQIPKAMEYLIKAGDADEVELRQFLRTIEITSHIPAKIEKINRDASADGYIERFLSADYYLPLELVNEINTTMIEIPAKYEVLELGSNVGACGIEMRKRLAEQFDLTGVETSDIMFDISQTIENKENEKNYTALLNMPVEDYLANNNKKFDVVISLNGLAFTSELDKLFAKVKLSLKRDGLFAFVLNSSSQTSLDTISLEFQYSADTVTEALLSNNFEIIIERELKLEKNNSFYIFVVKST